MRTLSATVQSALEADTLVPRDFLWIEARDSNGADVTWGAWSDLGTVKANVIHPTTGSTVLRTYEGAGDLVQISEVPLVMGLVVQTVTIRLSQIGDKAEQLVREYDARRASVELHRGLLNPRTMKLEEPAELRFYGFVDEVDVETPAEGGEGAITLTCTSHTQELTRASADKRSDASQRLRNLSDGFYGHTASVGQWTIWWGQAPE